MKDLDTLLSLQLAVAWAGEKGRLSWWRTQLLDHDLGLDLFTRDLGFSRPRWAAWQSVREAARLVDERARGEHADPTSLTTLFHWGVDLDEQLEDRLRSLQAQSDSPEAALPLLQSALGQDDYDVDDWRRDGFDSLLAAQPTPRTRDTTLGREVRDTLEDPTQLARHLAGALLPLPNKYPMPYLEGIL